MISPEHNFSMNLMVLVLLHVIAAMYKKCKQTSVYEDEIREQVREFFLLIGILSRVAHII
jgi:hypothetical protein